MTRLPVYSTWYTFTQEIDTERVDRRGSLADEIGCLNGLHRRRMAAPRKRSRIPRMRRLVPDRAKFPDLAKPSGASRAIRCRRRPLDRAVAPGPREPSNVDPALSCHRPALGSRPELLCPRPTSSRGARALSAIICLRLVRDYRTELLKIDFLDQAMAYRDTGAGEGLHRHWAGHRAVFADARRALAEAATATSPLNSGSRT